MATDRLADAYVPDVIPEEDVDYFRRGGHGARMGWGESPALVAVDLTNEFVTDESPLGRGDTGQEAVAATERLLEVARDLDAPVFYTKPDYGHRSMYPPANSRKKESMDVYHDAEAQNVVHERLEPREEDVVIEKHRASAFLDTHLDSMLRYYDVDTIVVTGMTTSGCVRATVVDGFSRNFNVVVPIEGVADRSIISHEVALFDMDMKYADVTPLDDVVDRLATFV